MAASFRGELFFLSNFFPCSVFAYPSLEHAYQAAKTVDPTWRARIKGAASPGQAKRLGRLAPLRPEWSDTFKLDVMKQLLRAKFTRPDLAEALLRTQGELVESNTWHDGFWGSCTCGRCKLGLNHLGKLLTELRETLRR